MLLSIGEDQRIEVEHGDQQHSQDRAIRIIKEIITQPIAQRINDTIGPCPVQSELHQDKIKCGTDSSGGDVYY